VSVPARDVVRDPAGLPREGAPPTTNTMATRRPAAPARTTAARPPTSTPPQIRRRARRGPHLRFLVFAGVVTTSLVVAVVALNAVLAQGAFRVHALQNEVSDLRDVNGFLTSEVAGLSSPGRVAGWARARGMTVAEGVVVLRARGTGSDQGTGSDPGAP
jgi:cell division protein FtsL